MSKAKDVMIVKEELTKMVKEYKDKLQLLDNINKDVEKAKALLASADEQKVIAQKAIADAKAKIVDHVGDELAGMILPTAEAGKAKVEGGKRSRMSKADAEMLQGQIATFLKGNPKSNINAIASHVGHDVAKVRPIIGKMKGIQKQGNRVNMTYSIKG